MADQRIALKDFLFPQSLLERTGAADNPLVVYSDRRAQRVWRVLLKRVLELIILLGALCFSATRWSPFYLDAAVRSRTWRPPEPLVGGGYFLPALSQAEILVGVFIWSFLMLRYHLFSNDQSHHMKVMQRDQLEHLLLTRLTHTDYFLHHLLRFCLHYGVIIIVAVVALVHFLFAHLGDQWRWIEPQYWMPVFGLLAVVLYVWLAGVGQYLFEWQHFAAGRGTLMRQALTFPFSALLAVPAVAIWYPFNNFGRWDNLPELAPAIIAIPFAFLIGAQLLRLSGQKHWRRAEALLWRRFGRDDIRAAGERHGPSGWQILKTILLPWRAEKGGPGLFRQTGTAWLLVTALIISIAEPWGGILVYWVGSPGLKLYFGTFFAYVSMFQGTLIVRSLTSVALVYCAVLFAKAHLSENNTLRLPRQRTLIEFWIGSIISGLILTTVLAILYEERGHGSIAGTFLQTLQTALMTAAVMVFVLGRARAMTGSKRLQPGAVAIIAGAAGSVLTALASGTLDGCILFFSLVLDSLLGDDASWLFAAVINFPPALLLTLLLLNLAADTLQPGAGGGPAPGAPDADPPHPSPSSSSATRAV